MSTLRILGSADWHVTAHNDNSCYLIDDCALIDACSTSIMQMLNAGINPLNVNTSFAPIVSASVFSAVETIQNSGNTMIAVMITAKIARMTVPTVSGARSWRG